MNTNIICFYGEIMKIITKLTALFVSLIMTEEFKEGSYLRRFCDKLESPDVHFMLKSNVVVKYLNIWTPKKLL